MTVAFRYRAARPGGDLVEGVLQATSPAEAQEQLRRQSLVPVSLDAAANVSRVRSRASSGTAFRSLATLLSAGQSLDRALTFATEHAASPAEAQAWTSVLRRIRDGASLSEAMATEPGFSPLVVAMVRAGEEGGSLDGALAAVAAHQERSAELAARVRNALLYPVLMGIVSALGLGLVLTVAVPRFVAMLDVTGGSLPWSTRLLMGMSGAITGGWLVWSLLLVAGVVGTRTWLSVPGNRLRWHSQRLRLPVSGALERELSGARFCRALGTLLAAGVPLLAALRLSRGVVRNEAIAGAFERAGAAVSRGDGVAQSLGDALPPLAGQLLLAGEEGGQLDAMCLRSADLLDAGVERQLQALVRLIEPALIIVFGGLVGFVALAMLQAVYAVRV